MKTLNEYIEESILDVDDLVADDNLFIEKWLKENCKIFGSYTIKNGVVDVKGKVILNPSITSIDVQFGVVNGSFSCGCCDNLKNLKGSPKKVTGMFTCAFCDDLESLEGGPVEVGKSFNCSVCPSLTSLEGAPKKVKNNFSCASCKSLTSLKGAPKEVGGYFDCSECHKLTTLEGAPKCEKIISDLK